MSQLLFMDIWKVECTIVLSKACTIFGKIFGSLSFASVTKTFFNIKTSQTWKPVLKDIVPSCPFVSDGKILSLRYYYIDYSQAFVWIGNVIGIPFIGMFG